MCPVTRGLHQSEMARGASSLDHSRKDKRLDDKKRLTVETAAPNEKEISHGRVSWQTH